MGGVNKTKKINKKHPLIPLPLPSSPSCQINNVMKDYTKLNIDDINLLDIIEELKWQITYLGEGKSKSTLLEELRDFLIVCCRCEGETKREEHDRLLYYQNMFEVCYRKIQEERREGDGEGENYCYVLYEEPLLRDPEGNVVNSSFFKAQDNVEIEGGIAVCFMTPYIKGVFATYRDAENFKQKYSACSNAEIYKVSLYKTKEMN